VTRLLAGRPQAAGLPVPGCPGWSVRTAVAHLLGVCHRVAGIEEPAPAADTDLTELLGAWAESGAHLETLLESGARGANGVVVMDLFTHELDIRQALTVPPPAEHPGYPTAFHVVTSGFSASVRGHGLPPLSIETPGARWTTEAGPGPPAAAFGGPRYALLRSLTGRRSRRQIAGLTWSQDPSPWLPAFRWGPFAPPPAPVE
jgi:uncharacterized protein (TIGR03083 family)